MASYSFPCLSYEFMNIENQYTDKIILPTSLGAFGPHPTPLKKPPLGDLETREVLGQPSPFDSILKPFNEKAFSTNFFTLCVSLVDKT